MKAHSWRVVLGFAISPAVPGLAIYLWQLAVSTEANARWAASLLLAVSYLAAMIFGIPAYLIFGRKLGVKLSRYLVVGFVLGAVAVALLFVPDIVSNWHSNREHSMALAHNGLPLLGGISGALSAIVFWLIVIRGDVGRVVR